MHQSCPISPHIRNDGKHLWNSCKQRTIEKTEFNSQSKSRNKDWPLKIEAFIFNHVHQRTWKTAVHKIMVSLFSTKSLKISKVNCSKWRDLEFIKNTRILFHMRVVSLYNIDIYWPLFRIQEISGERTQSGANKYAICHQLLHITFWLEERCME